MLLQACVHPLLKCHDEILIIFSFPESASHLAHMHQHPKAEKWAGPIWRFQYPCMLFSRSDIPLATSHQPGAATCSQVQPGATEARLPAPGGSSPRHDILPHPFRWLLPSCAPFLGFPRPTSQIHHTLARDLTMGLSIMPRRKIRSSSAAPVALGRDPRLSKTCCMAGGGAVRC